MRPTGYECLCGKQLAWKKKLGLFCPVCDGKKESKK